MTRPRMRAHEGFDGGAARVLTGATVLVAAGLAADAGGVAALPGRVRPAGWTLGVTSGFVVSLSLGGLVALVGLVVLFARRPRRRQDGPTRVPIPPMTSRVMQVFVLLVALAAIAAPPVLLLTTPRHPAATPPSMTITRAAPAPAAARAHRTASGAGHHLGRDALLLAALTGVLVASAAGAAMRQRRRDAPVVDRTEEGDDTDLRTDVAAAASAAEAALDADNDPRAAVIAAYSAMTRAFTAADPQLRDTHTPGRLLERAAAAGVVDVSAATALIRLFEHARFSRHPVTPTHVAAARDALARVRASSRTEAGAR